LSIREKKGTLALEIKNIHKDAKINIQGGIARWFS
jgi:hypothetical protein